jgi:hypothetical protein
VEEGSYSYFNKSTGILHCLGGVDADYGRFGCDAM